MTTTTRRIGAALAITTAFTVATPGASWASTSHHRPSYAKVFSGKRFVGPHRKWVLVDHRDPIKTKVQYDEDDVRWNCTVDGDGGCGEAKPVRGFITKTQQKRFHQRFHRQDVCLAIPDDVFGAVWCTDGRTYAKRALLSVQV